MLLFEISITETGMVLQVGVTKCLSQNNMTSELD